MNFSIILAAGSSKRMQGINKIFHQIDGRPLIFYTISALEKNPRIKKIILVVRRADIKKFLLLIKKYRFRKIDSVVIGGKERQASAFNGFKAAEKLGAKEKDLILFHNGVNPLILQKEINKVIKMAKKYGAAFLGQKAKDTIKKVDKNNFVLKTIARENIYLAQTPQAMEYTLAKKSFEKARLEKFKGTDDVSLVERLGKKVRAVPCSYKNIKVTTREDLKIIESFLKKS